MNLKLSKPRKRKCYIVKVRISTPNGADGVDGVINQTLYLFEKNKCKVVWRLIVQAEELIKYSLRLEILEIKKENGDIVDFTQTRDDHLLKHLFRCSS